ncbi:MAG: hypothetical protein AB8B73_10525 [Ekhidna sp.]
MIKSNSLLLLTLVSILQFLSSCEKEETFVIPTLEGEYEGMFTVEYKNGNIFSNPVTITFNSNNYTSSKGESFFPAGGEGSFEIGNDRITFSDTNYYTANFDWNLILNGEYDIELSENIIVFTADKNGLGSYTYRMSLK